MSGTCLTCGWGGKIANGPIQAAICPTCGKGPIIRKVEVKFDFIYLKINDGNKASLTSQATLALRRAGIPDDVIAKFRREALAAADVDSVLDIIGRWVNVT